MRPARIEYSDTSDVKYSVVTAHAVLSELPSRWNSLRLPLEPQHPDIWQCFRDTLPWYTEQCNN